MENKKWIFLCILGGTLMILGCATGSIVLYEIIYNLALGNIGEELATIFSIILKIFGYIAAAGGASVIIGALIVAMGRYRLGKFIIGLGVGLGLISLIIFIITGIIEGTITGFFIELITELIALKGGFGFTGAVLTFFSRRQLKKEEKKD